MEWVNGVVRSGAYCMRSGECRMNFPGVGAGLESEVVRERTVFLFGQGEGSSFPSMAVINGE